MRLHRILMLASLWLLPMVHGRQHGAMRLSDINILVFEAGSMTTARRSHPIPQLECTAGCHLHPVTSVACKNAGMDGQDVIWKCELELPSNIILIKQVVNCEGFSSPDDPLVTVGSCGLEYALGELKPKEPPVHFTSQPTQPTVPPTNTDATVAAVIIFIVLGFGILWCCLALVEENSRRRRIEIYPAPVAPVVPAANAYGAYGMPVQPQPTFIVNQPANDGFWTGAALGYVSAGRSSTEHHHHHYPTVTTAPVQPAYSQPVTMSTSSAGTPFSTGSSTTARTSSGYAKTKRR